MYICVGIPSARGIDVEVFVSLINNIMSLSREHSVTIITSKAFPLDLARNSIVRNALAYKCDKLIFIDDDVLITSNDGLLKLVNEDYPIVTGLYVLKLGYLNIYNITMKNNVVAIDLFTDPVDECDGAGLGLISIDMSVFKSLSEPWFKFVLDLVNNEYYVMGEDVYFFNRVKNELGIKVKVRKDVWGLHKSTVFLRQDKSAVITR